MGDIRYGSTQARGEIDHHGLLGGMREKGGSSEYKTVMNDGGILFICVSNRADGCGNNACQNGCRKSGEKWFEVMESEKNSIVLGFI